MRPRVRLVIQYLIFLTVITAVLGTSACSIAAASPKKPTSTPFPTAVIPEKPTYIVQRGEVIRRLDISGRVAPVSEHRMYFQSSGSVDSVLVKSGDAVSAGQELARLRSGNREFEIQRAQVRLQMAQYDLDLARLRTPEDSPEYKMVIGIKEGEVKLAQIALDELNAAVDEARLVAPSAGTVIAVNIGEGDQVSALAPVITIADLSHLEVSTDVLSGDLAKLQEGMRVKIIPVSDPSLAFEGAIRRMPYPYGAAAGEGQASGGDQSVRIAFSGQELPGQVHFGDIVKIVVILESKSGVLWLPIQAIRTYEGRKFVIARQDTGQQRVDVNVGVVGDDRVEIVEGLEEGQVVLAP